MDKTISVRLIAKVGEYNAGLASASGTTRKFGSDVQQSGKRAANAATGLAATAAMAGKAILLGIGGAMAVSAKAAVEFESSLTGVAKTTNLAGGAFDRANSPLAQFGDQLRRLALTEVPLNVNELAKIAELGGQLGVAVPDLIDFTEVVAKLGVTTNLATQEGATGLARFMNIMRTDFANVDRIGSAIVALGNNFATTEAEILGFAVRLAPIGATVGATESEILALSTALTSLGIPAERGGTALQRVFIKMKSAVDGGGDSLAAFARATGMTEEAFSKLFRTSPARAFAALAKGLDDINESGGNVFGTLDQLELSEQRTVATLLAVASGYEVLDEAIGMSDDAYRENIALNEEAALRFGTNASQVQFLANTFNDLKIEIGNMLIGRGGLIAFIDGLRAFLEIVTENIDAVGGFTKVLGGIAFLSVGLGLQKVIGSLVAKAVAWKTLGTAIKTGTATFGTAQRALAGLAITMNVALAAAALVAAAWAWQAVKAAELRAQVRQLNDEIEGGKDPVDALISSLRESGDITSDFEDVLARQGISVREWATAMLEGKGAVDDLFGTRPQDVGLAALLDFSFLAQDITTDVNSVVTASQAANEVVGELFSKKKNEIRQQIMDLDSAANMTYEEVDHLAQKMLDFFGLNVSASEVGKWLAGDQQLRADFGWGEGFLEETREVEKSFMEIIKNLDDGGTDILVGIFEDAQVAVQNYREFMSEAFGEIADSIRGSFPAWDEYERTTSLGLNAAMASQRLYLLDLQDWVDNRQSMLAIASPETREFIEAMSLPDRAAMARGWAAGDTIIRSFILNTNESFDRMNEHIGTVMMQEAPALAREGMNLMLAEITGTVVGSDIPGVTGYQLYEAVLEGIKFAANELDVPVDEFFAGMNFEDKVAFFRELGIDLATALGLGLIEGLNSQGNAVGSSVDALNERLKKEFKDGVEVKSPSKFTYYIGEMLGEGLRLGWADGVRDFDMTQPVRQAIQPNAAFSPSITLEGSGSSRSFTQNNHIYNPKTRNLDRDLRKTAALAGAHAEFGG